eukprot:COSAG01_NODE_15940_length_1284_cov_1.971308_3_plen_31_part_01
MVSGLQEDACGGVRGGVRVSRQAQSYRSHTL